MLPLDPPRLTGRADRDATDVPGAAGATASPLPAQEAAPINALVYLINTDAEAEIDGLLRWELELRERGLTAMIKASNPMLEAYPEVFRRLAEAGNEIIGGYPGICWDKPYEEQLAARRRSRTTWGAGPASP